MGENLGRNDLGPTERFAFPGLPPIASLPLNPRPARLVFLLQDLKFGGTQRQTLELARRLDPARFRVELWMMMAGDDFFPLARDWGIPLLWLGRSSWVGPQSLVNLWRRLRAHPIHLLMPLTVVPNIWGRILGHLARVPVIIGNCRSGVPQRQHESWLWRLTNHIICNSKAEKDLLTKSYGIPAGRISMILNGIDTEIFQPSEYRRTGAPIVLSVGRLEPQKDQESLICAFRLVADRHPEAKLWIVGDGSLRKALERLIDQQGLTGRVRLIPARINLRPLFSKAALFVLSSRWEGLPNVVLEAMASGLPVVATRVGGLPEVVAPGETGWLAPPRDIPAMAAAISHLLGDPGARRALGQAGRRRVVRDFSLPVMVRRHEELFQGLLAARKSPGPRARG